ncbi:MAG TPA: hypothetical protein PLS63_06540 [Microthrixaceae bacterium]|nr:hypothetical protein [Microthrixaceae bacterium]
MPSRPSTPRLGGLPPQAFLRQLQALGDLVASIEGPCWVAGTTAAALLGLDGFALKPPFHVAVPNGRRVLRHQHVVHRLRSVSNLDTTTAMGLPCLSATRVLIELARTETPKRLTAALDSALRDGLTSEDFLHRRLVGLRSRGRSGVARMLDVLAGSEASRGGHSYLERAFLEFVGELGFPLPLTQQVLARRGRALIRVDCRFPGTNVVAELLGYRWHRTAMQMTEDSERLNRLQLDGFAAMQFTYMHVVTRSEVIRQTLGEALSRSA